MGRSRGRVLVVGLGPGDPDLLTVAARRAIDVTSVRYVRTTRHPSAAAVPDALSFDGLYESAAALEEVYEAIAAALAAAAADHGEVLYAVPGSPMVAERSVELLRQRAAAGEVELEVQAALSFLDLAWARLGVDPVAVGARLVDGHRFAVEAAGAVGPLLVAQCDSRFVLSDIKLAADHGGEGAGGEGPGPVTVLQRLGLPDELVTQVAWVDLDRAVEPDHLTCLWIPRLAVPVAAEAARFVELVCDLRERCPWDRAQTHASLRRHVIEEAYEVVDAIDEVPSDEGWEHLEEELGDLLFQVVFHAQLAREEGRFDFADVARGIHDKLVARHPHLFGADTIGTAESTDRSWEQRKKLEKGRASVTEGVPTALPALARAEKLQRRAAGLGLDWSGPEDLWPVVQAELTELRDALAGEGEGEGEGEGRSGAAHGAAGPRPQVAAEVGDVLFSVVNLARKLDVDAEMALRAASARFAARVAGVERLAAERGIDDVALARLDPAAVDDLWQEAKRLGG